MKNRIVLWSILFVLFYSGYSYSKEPLELVGTRWNNFVTEESFNYILFLNDSSYISYNCELDEKYFGTYDTKNDTVILIQERGEFDDQFPEGSKHKAIKSKSKYIYLDGKLKLVWSQIYTMGKWEKPIINFETEIIYIKDETYNIIIEKRNSL